MDEQKTAVTIQEELARRVPRDTHWYCYEDDTTPYTDLAEGEEVSFPSPFGWQPAPSRYQHRNYSLQGHVLDVLDAIQKIRDSSEEGTHCTFSFLGLAMNHGWLLRLDFTLMVSNKVRSRPGPLRTLRATAAESIRHHLDILNFVLDYDEAIRRVPELGLAG